jgi:AcrR family transcriptional regulator
MPLRHLHPTGIELVKTVDQLLDLKRADEITSEEVLKESGISKGSLYHHFVDLPDLVETTLIYRYSKWIDLSIQRMSGLLNTAKTPKALKEALFQITFATQKDSLKDAIERDLYPELHPQAHDERCDPKNTTPTPLKKDPLVT